MPIPEKVVAEVVAEASAKMNDPRYAETMVDAWVRSQPDATRYVTAHAKELGSTEAVVNTIFHAALLAQCFRRHVGRTVPSMSFGDLDTVASFGGAVDLRKRQPALHDYVVANVEHPEARKVLILLALGMDFVT